LSFQRKETPSALETVLAGKGRACDTIIYLFIHSSGGAFNVIPFRRLYFCDFRSDCRKH